MFNNVGLMNEDLILRQGDCLVLLKDIPDKSVDMIFSDLPYGTTKNEWDCLINLNLLFKEYNRVIKDNGCIALWCQVPFSVKLAAANLKYLKYEWIIEKTRATGHLNAKKCPMKAHEKILIFYKEAPVFNPQMTEGHKPLHSYTKHKPDGSCYGKTKTGISGGGRTSRYPRSVLQFKWDTQKSKLHPCQKPLAACEYFIKTYTNEGDLVLDSCMGSNTIGLACKNLKRKFIGIELNAKFFEIAKQRVE